MTSILLVVVRFINYFFLALSLLGICQHNLFLVIILNNFKDDDDTDIIGCCTLKVDNVTCMPPDQI
jgi:hypothetical protein